MPTENPSGPTATLSIRVRLMVLAAIVLLPLMFDRVRSIEVNRVERIDTANQQVLAATKTAEQLRITVMAHCLPHAKAPSGHVTVSIGVASLRPAPGESSRILIEAADAALYAAKRRGRNTVVAHEPLTVLLAS
jgi:PleD family two-component response regulator